MLSVQEREAKIARVEEVNRQRQIEFNTWKEGFTRNYALSFLASTLWSSSG